MSVGFFETHRDFFAPTSVRDTLYSLPPANLPDVVATRSDMAAFKASARSLDQGIGAVLHALHDFGLVENTLVLCTTDHGVAFPGAKATLFDRGIGVMMIDARARRLHRRQGGRRAGQPPRRLPDPLRAGRGRAAGVAAGHLADAAGARRGRAPARGDLRRDRPTTPPTSRSARSAPSAGSTSGASTTTRTRCSPTATTAPARSCWSRRAGASRSSPREQLYDLVLDPGRGRQPRRRPGRRRGAGGDARTGSTPGCGRPRTRCWTARCAPPPGALVNEQWQVSPDDPAADRSRRIPRPLPSS